MHLTSLTLMEVHIFIYQAQLGEYTTILAIYHIPVNKINISNKWVKWHPCNVYI